MFQPSLQFPLSISSLYFIFCSEAKTRKTVTYNYATMLVLLVAQTSNDLRMMEHYAAPLLSIAKADETNAKLQGTCQHSKDQGAYTVQYVLKYILILFCILELGKWLEPLEKLRFEIGNIPNIIDYIKQVRILWK